MRVVHVEDQPKKIEKLASAVAVDETYTDSAGLASFMSGSGVNPGVAVLDVAVFSEETQEGMLMKGEKLADRGWHVIFWSSAAGPKNVRADCWYENRLDEAGFRLLVEAVRKGPRESGLSQGRKPHHRELALEVLSTLWACGLHWEALSDNDSSASLSDGLSRLTSAEGSDIGRIIVGQLWNHLSGETPGSIPRELRPSFSVLNNLIVSDILGADSARRWEKAQVSGPPGDLASALKVMAESGSPAQWNARLETLRDILLP